MSEITETITKYSLSFPLFTQHADFISGPQLSLMERSVDEIMLLSPASSSRIMEDDYISPQVRFA